MSDADRLMYDRRRLRDAYELAIKSSRDPRTQNAAILHTSLGTILGDANRFPQGVQELQSRWDRSVKLMYVEHAERNVLFKAAKAGISTFGSTMYVPWFACADCARAIIECGVERVVGHNAYFHGLREDWKKSLQIADEMLLEAGVEITRLDYKFGGLTLIFDGNEVHP